MIGLKNKSSTRFPSSSSPGQSNDLPWYSPRPWHGMTFRVWTRALANNKVSPARLPMAGLITACSVFNSFSRWRSEFTNAARAERTTIERDPIFVIGHWRTGTTFLHELMVQDSQFGYPTTFQCMAPHHFLRTAKVLPVLSARLLPKRRVMDNMDFRWDLPQEDEFALCNLGLPSPYLYWAFPNRRQEAIQALTLDALPESERKRWSEGFHWFLKRLTLNDPRQLILKSPPHTARVALIRQLYPNAKFIHLVRDPVAVIPSTIRTWKQMGKACEMHIGRKKQLEQLAYANLKEIYRAFWRDEQELGADQLCEIRYEDLIAKPLVQLRKVYEQFGLAGFDKAEQQFEAHLATKQGYRKNRFDMKPEFRQRIEKNCADYAQQYGYDKTASSSRGVDVQPVA